MDQPNGHVQGGFQHYLGTSMNKSDSVLKKAQIVLSTFSIVLTYSAFTERTPTQVPADSHKIMVQPAHSNNNDTEKIVSLS